MQRKGHQAPQESRDVLTGQVTIFDTQRYDHSKVYFHCDAELHDLLPAEVADRLKAMIP